MIETEKTLIKKLFKRVRLFKGLSEKYLNHVVNRFNILHLRQGEIVFYQTDNCTNFYLILKGKVKVTLLDEMGDELILNILEEGEFFGEMSVLDGRPRSATIVTEEDSSFGVLQRDIFINIIKDDPMVAIDLLSVLVQRFRNATDLQGSLAFLDVSHRLIKLFLQIAGTDGKRDENGWHKIKKLTHQELSTRIGSSREAVTKALKILVFKKVIAEMDKYFLISPDAKEMLDLF